MSQEKTKDKKILKNFSEILEKAPIGLITFSEDWKIDFANENFFRYGIPLSVDYSSIAGFNILENELIINVLLNDELLELKKGYSFEKELKELRTFDGSKISIIIKGSPLFTDEKFSGGILVVEDLKIYSDVKSEDLISFHNLTNIFNKFNDLFFITDEDGSIKYSLGRHLRRLSIPASELNDLNIKHILNTPSKEDFSKSFSHLKEKRSPGSLEIELALGKESLRYECKMEPLLNKKGQINFIAFLLNDVTSAFEKNKNVESELEELRRYQVITESVTDAVFAIDSEGKIIFWNTASENLFGFVKSEIYGKFFGKALGLSDLENFSEIKDELNNTGTWKSRFNVFTKDQKKEIIEANFSSMGNDTIIVLCSNITEKINIEEQLSLSEEKFRNIVTQADEFICNLDPEGNINYANPVFINSLKYEAGELLKKNIRDIIDPQYLKQYKFDIKIFKANPDQTVEIPLITKRKNLLYTVAKFSPVYSSDNQLRFFNAFFTDITEKKAAEKNLMIFQSLFESSQDGIAVESDGKVILSNNSFADIFGYTKGAELIDKEILDLVSFDDTVKVSEYLQLIVKKKNVPGRFEFLGKRKDGSHFFTEVSVSSFESEEKTFIVLVTRDITERKRAQQAIRQSEEKYRNITENIDDFLYTFERTVVTLRPVFYTASVEKITGYSQTEFLSDSKLFLKTIHPDDFSFVKKKIKNLLRSRIQLTEEFEFRIINKHGNIVWVRNKVNLARNNEGQVQKIYGLVSDITFRKRAEDDLKRSSDNLMKLNETKDRFISIISHDLRTPFSSILGFTDLLLSDSDLNEDEQKQYIKFIQDSSKSMLSLVNSLLDWTRLQTGRIRFEPERIKLNNIINDSFNSMSGASMQKHIKLVSNVADNFPVFVDKNLILQVLNNLISNSIKFTKEEGEISVNILPSDKVRFTVISVKDNGMGIKEENLEKLFKVDTKFTSEGTAGEKGSGLGLSLVKEIIEKHGGSIWVESEYGKGSEFKFYLPTTPANILLVDDSKTDRILYSKILKNITPDYSVDIASTGKEALERILKSPPALVITDHTMPEMSGYDLIIQLQKSDLEPIPPIMVLSSDIDRTTIDDYRGLGIEYVFHKPVNLSNFKSAVEKSLKKSLLAK